MAAQVYIKDLDEKATNIFKLMNPKRIPSNHFKYKFEPFFELFKTNYPEDYQRLEDKYREEVKEFKNNRKGNKKPKPISTKDRLFRIYNRYLYLNYLSRQYKKKMKRLDDRYNGLIQRANRVGYSIKRNRKKYTLYDLDTKETMYRDLSYKEVESILKKGKKG